jgi:ribosomal protein S18 acetylase RimI-like enzyme
MDLLIRPLGENDGGAFAKLRLAAVADSPTAIWTTAEEEAMRTPEQVWQRIRPDSNQIVFGAFADAELIAMAGLRRESLVQLAHKASIWGVFVRPEFRKEGIARRLLAHIREHAEAAGVLQIHLSVNAENQRAKRLYESLGFQTFGLEPRCTKVGGQFYDEAHMCLLLSVHRAS